MPHVEAPDDRLTAAVHRAAAPDATRTHRHRHAPLATVTTAAAALLSVAILAALACGLRPTIIRSGSMEPALRVGDIVLVQDVRASDLRVGEIATVGASTDDGGMTHRVERMSPVGDHLVVETRGDANPTGERWVLHRTERVGRVEHRIPRIGIALAWLISDTGRPHFAGVAIVLAVAAIAVTWAPWRGRRDAQRT